MKKMLNRVILLGRIIQNPELKQTPNGVTVTSFTIAVDRQYVKGQDKQTDFINCVAWRQTAEFICRYFGKGKMIALEGSLQVRNYTDKNQNKRQAVEVIVSQVYFAGDQSSPKAQQTPDAQPQYAQQKTMGQPPSAYGTAAYQDFPELDSDEDLPF